MNGSSTGKSKRIDFKKTIKKSIDGKLNEMGYYFDAEKSWSGIIHYCRKVNCFHFRIIFNKSRFGNSFCVYIQYPTNGELDLNYLLFGQGKIFEYGNEEELISQLEKIIKLIGQNRDYILHENEFVGFDSLSLYAKYVDTFLRNFSYNRTFTSDNFNEGGYIEYSNDASKIVFTQLSGTAYIKCDLILEGKRKTLKELSLENGTDINLYEIYHNETEYKDRLLLNLNILKLPFLDSQR